MLHTKFEVTQSSLSFRALQTYCSPTAEILRTCCCPAAEELQNPLDKLHTKFEVCRSSFTCSRVLQNFCRPAAEMLQNCYRLTADYEGTLHRDVGSQRCCQLCRDLDRVSLAGEIHTLGALCLVVQKKVGTGPEQL